MGAGPFPRAHARRALALCAVAVWGNGALAGGLGVREQSASSQGASFAGAAAGGDLSSSFWNPAAMSTAGSGLATESHVALIHTDIDVHAESVSVLPGSMAPPGTELVDDTSELDRWTPVGASYAAWRATDDIVLGLAVNAPFGTQNKADDPHWSGQYHFRSSRLLTIAVNPIVTYQLAPGLSIGGGPQLEYMALTIKANPSGGLAPPQRNSALDGDDIGFGYTAGILWQPSPATSIGLGFRSSVSHTLDGDASMAGGELTTGFGPTLPFSPVDFKAELHTPEIVTLSLRQAIASDIRLLATAEWTNWSRLDQVDFIAKSSGGTPGAVSPGQTISVLDFHWNDGWFFALGGEWDYSGNLTLRAGAAYEISPIRDADQRKINVSDSDRIWLSVGATYALSTTTAIDFAYTHVIFDDAPIDSLTTTPGGATTPVRQFIGEADEAADIVSASLKTKW